MERKSIRAWGRVYGIPEGTVGSWTRHLPPGTGIRIGSAIALTKKEFEAMMRIAKSRKRGRERR